MLGETAPRSNCKSMFEVELKFSVTDRQPIIDRLVRLGASPLEELEQRDVYFRHPMRDFAATDEALRLRSVNGRHCVTYKGPVIDAHTKTRREIEVLLAEGDEVDRQFSEILGHLGFLPVRSVQKHRTPWHLIWHNRDFEVALDDVADLGTFVEIETIAAEPDRATARDAILALATRLQLSAPERNSYLGLLLARDASKGCRSGQ